jgi:hypothetical protein
MFLETIEIVIYGFFDVCSSIDYVKRFYFIDFIMIEEFSWIWNIT